MAMFADVSTLCKFLKLNIDVLSSFPATCLSNSDCGLDEQCIEGQCLNPCELKSSCGINSQCIVVNHIKTCQCPESFTGDSAIECMRGECLVYSCLHLKQH